MSSTGSGDVTAVSRAEDSISKPDPSTSLDNASILDRNSSELPVSEDPQLDEGPMDEPSQAILGASGPHLASNAGIDAGMQKGEEGLPKQPTAAISGNSGKPKVELSADAMAAHAAVAQEAARSALSMFSFGFGTKKDAEKIPLVEAEAHANVAAVVDKPVAVAVSVADSVAPAQTAFGSLGMRLMDMRNNAVKVVQTKARHLVSQNKRRYQEGGFDLDMTYITDSIIAMGFPGGDISSGMLGYIEGFYRNHMEDVIKFLDMHHKDKYKVYNLCAERLYDPSLLEGKVASFPFDDHNCPPLHLLRAFCQSAKSWLAGGLDNVVVVHCKAGMGRTGLMISCLLLYLKFFPTAEEAVAYFNGKRCTDGRALVLPSQIRYVKYFEMIQREHNGEAPRSRKCVLRGIRLHRCPYWIRPSIVVSNHSGVLFSSKKHPRTRDLMADDIWHNAPRKGVVVFALPGEPCVADIGSDDFRIYLQDRHGDFFFWLNPNMIGSREFLSVSDLDWFDQRKLPAPGFQVEVVLMESDSMARRAEATVPKSVLAASSPLTPARAPASAHIASHQSPPAAASAATAKGVSEEKATGGVEGSSAGQLAAGGIAAAREEGGDIFTDSEGEDHEPTQGGGKARGETASSSSSALPPDSTADAAKAEQGAAAAGPTTSAFEALANAMAGMGGTSAGIGKGIEAGLKSFMGITIPGTGQLPVEKKPAGTPSRDDAPQQSPAAKTESNQQQSAVATSVPAKSPEILDASKSASIGLSAPLSSSSSSVVKVDVDGARSEGQEKAVAPSMSPTSDFKAIAAAAADSSVFSFGDEEDYLSD